MNNMQILTGAIGIGLAFMAIAYKDINTILLWVIFGAIFIIMSNQWMIQSAVTNKEGA